MNRMAILVVLLQLHLLENAHHLLLRSSGQSLIALLSTTLLLGIPLVSLLAHIDNINAVTESTVAFLGIF